MIDLVLEHGSLSREPGHPRLIWRSLLLGSMRALARGEFALSERLVVEVEQLAGSVDEQSLEMCLAAQEWHASLASYRVEATREALTSLLRRLRPPLLRARRLRPRGGSDGRCRRFVRLPCTKTVRLSAEHVASVA